MSAQKKVIFGKPIHIVTQATYEALNMPSTPHKKHITILATEYVHKKCGVPDYCNFGNKSIAQICNKVCQHLPDQTAEAQFKKFLQDNLPASMLAGALQLSNKAQEARVLNAVNHSTEVQTAAAATIRVSLSPTTTSGSAAKKRKIISEEEKVTWKEGKDYKAQAAKQKNKAGLLIVIRHAMTEVAAQVEDGKKLVDPIKTWIYKAGKAVKCVDDCYDGKDDAFLKAHPKFTIGRNWQCPNNNDHKAFD